MKVAYFDTIAGISGDMTLAAFLSAGLSVDELRRELRKLNIEGIELQPSHVERNGISAVKIDVEVSTPQKSHRHLNNILKLIEESGLPARVKERAGKIFQELGKAEAKVHNTTIEKVHFHEVGALDSITDIVGAAICLEKFGIERVYSSAVKLGSGGFIKAEHGMLPLPGPAAVEILKGYPVVLTDIPFELTTPTGAAIIKALSSGTLSPERLSIDAIGYGAGTRELPGIPNVLRVIIGDLVEESEAAEDLVLLETNIDNMNPEVYPYIIEQLLARGVNDAYLTPVIMKKGRPGVVLSVLLSALQLDSITSFLLQETTTLGVRYHPVARRKVQRAELEMQTPYGIVRVKNVGSGESLRFVPEYEECKRIAAERDIPLVDVYRGLEIFFQSKK